MFLHNHNLLFVVARSSIQDRKHAAQAVLESKIASQPVTKVQLRKIDLEKLLRIKHFIDEKRIKNNQSVN
jgi:hypothetical protein